MAIIPISESARRRTDYEVFQGAYTDFITHLQSLRKFRDRELTKLSQLTGVARRNRVRSLLSDRSLHLLYAYEGTLKAKRLREATPDTIMELASRCNPFQPCNEPGTLRFMSKRGRRRLVSAFGPAKRMHQLLVADIIRSLHPPLEQQYLFRGGMPAAFRAVEAAFHEGFTFAAEIDMIDFYGSVRLEGLADLMRPLPETVVRHVVWDGGFMTRMRQDDCVSVFMRDDDPSSSAQRGLALGSACSPIVGERILACLLAPSDSIRLVAYADNIFVLGRSHRGLHQYVDQMRERASGFVGWALEQRIGAIRNLRSESFTFLRNEGRVVDDAIVWSPDYPRQNEMLLAEAGLPITLGMIEEAENRVSNWRRAYPLWPDGDEWEVRQLASLAARRFYLRATPLHRANAAQALVSAYLTLGRSVSLDELAPEGSRTRDLARRVELLDAAEARLTLMAQRGGWDRQQVALHG
jgi:hypothetical protein